MLQVCAEWVTGRVLGLSPQSPIGGIVTFFIHDSVKIIALLFGMITVIGVMRTFLPQDRLRKLLCRQGIFANAAASAFGAVTPFCSCSSIPVFLGLLKAGVPLGVALSFLITSPLINEYLAVLMLGYFGWKVTAAYVAGGMLMGIVAGLVIGGLRQEKNLEPDYACPDEPEALPRFDCFSARVSYGIREALGVIRGIWVWVLAGVGMGALIHNYVPRAAVDALAARTGIFSVPLATALGVPFYGSCAAIVPIALVLFEKGFPLGTSLSFMMAVAALSLPEAFMLRRALRPVLVGIFFGVTALGIVVIGYAFNLLQGVLV